MTYANKRVRDSMRREMTADSYRDWRWLPPVLSYGWATFVGWSRIHSYKHFISDVAVGALAGWAMAELFYYFGERSHDDSEFGSGAGAMIALTIKF
jgi:membrane-associated phospholipid phosphatase